MFSICFTHLFIYDLQWVISGLLIRLQQALILADVEEHQSNILDFFHGHEMCTLFNKAEFSRSKVFHNWIYWRYGLLFMPHDVPEMWAMEETMFTEATSCSQRCSTTLHYKRGKQWQRKIIIHLIFTIQPDNLTHWVVFVVFVSLFDKIPNTELPFNKEGALPFCSPKNQQSTGGRQKTAYQIGIHYFCLSQCEK